MNACDQPVQIHTHIISRSIPPLFCLLKRMSASLCFSVALAVKIVGKRKGGDCARLKAYTVDNPAAVIARFM